MRSKQTGSDGERGIEFVDFFITKSSRAYADYHSMREMKRVFGTKTKLSLQAYLPVQQSIKSTKKMRLESINTIT